MQPYQVKGHTGSKASPSHDKGHAAGGLLLYESRERERKPTFDVVHFSFGLIVTNPG